MKNNVRNSFYEQNLKGLKVLVLAPHQDDEINIAGNTIANLVNCGADVKVCFSTNGDYTLPASVRIREAVASLKKLGCNKQNIYFLGCRARNARYSRYQHWGQRLWYSTSSTVSMATCAPSKTNSPLTLRPLQMALRPQAQIVLSSSIVCAISRSRVEPGKPRIMKSARRP